MKQFRFMWFAVKITSKLHRMSHVILHTCVGGK